MTKGRFSFISLTLIAVTCSITAPAQTVDFRNNQNDFPTTADRDVYNVDMMTPLVGTNFQARLLYGADASNLQVATYNTPTRFRNVSTGSATAGTWQGGNRTLAGFSSGDTVTLVVQVWDAGPDLIPGSPTRTFDQARATGHLWMESSPFTYTIPHPGSAVAKYYIDNFRGIRPGSCPAPGRLSILETNGQIQLTFNGAQPVEVSDDLVTWTRLGAQGSPFVDSSAAGLNRRFYRLRCDSLVSPNYVGFYRKAFYPGYTFLGNHLILPDQRVTAIFPAPPENTTIFRYLREWGGYVLASYVDGAWEGDDVGMELPPGGGILVSTSVPFAKTFVGEVIMRSTNALPAGYSLISSIVPQGMPLTGNAGLGFPVSEGDTLYQYNRAAEGYDANQFLDGAWEGAASGAPPMLSVGECFFLFRQEPGLWVRDISPSP